MTRSASRGMSGHHSAKAQTVEWLTPAHIIPALGGAESFGLDPCAPAVQPWPTARRTYTVTDDGLAQPWGAERVWLNPPYSESVIARWLGRLAEHGCGTAFTFARTDTVWFVQHIWGRATALLFLWGREHFCRPDGTPAAANSGGPLVLSAYGRSDAEVLGDCALPGQFVPLLLPRMIQIAALEATWRQVIRDAFGRHDGPMRLSDLYAALARHPKTRRNPKNWKPKLRQVLQRGAGERVAPGVWRVA